MRPSIRCVERDKRVRRFVAVAVEDECWARYRNPVIADGAREERGQALIEYALLLLVVALVVVGIVGGLGATVYGLYVQAGSLF